LDSSAKGQTRRKRKWTQLGTKLAGSVPGARD